MPDNFGYYNVLGVNKDASPQEIKNAYRGLAKKYHPDVCKEKDCVRKFREATEAYEFLKDPKQRTIYNTQYTNWNQFSQDESYHTSLNQIIINLINSLNNPYSLLRNYAVEALVSIGQPAFEPVLKASNNSDEVVRRKTCDILGKMRNTQGIPALIRLLNDPDRHVRRRAAKALIRIADKSAVIPLMNALNDSERKVRYRSAEALGKIGDPRAIDSLIKSLSDPSSTVRRKSIQALGRIGDYRAVGLITLCLNDDSPHVRATAKKTLKEKFHMGSRPRFKPQERDISSDICPNCSHPVLPDTNYCPECGFNLKREMDHCPKCGSPQSPNSNYCTSCGNLIVK